MQASLFLGEAPRTLVAETNGMPCPPPPRARRDDPQTSIDAGDSAAELARRHYLVLAESLRTHGPQTIHELAASTGLTHVQAARRLPEERSLFALVPDVTRKSPAGRACRVWKLVGA